MKKLIVFDLDGTLAESKSALDAEMAALLSSLLAVSKAAVISGGNWPQFERQLLAALPAEARLKNLSLLPACGTKFYQYGSRWTKLYSEDLTGEEKARIVRALERAVRLSRLKIDRRWGEQIEDRGSQITFSALGQRAPAAEKKAWDPAFTKRASLKAHLLELLPEYSVNLGGATSVDVTRRGIDKGYGIFKLRDLLGIATDEMIFIGDALFPGGNDHPAGAAVPASIQVRDPAESKRLIRAIVACLS